MYLFSISLALLASMLNENSCIEDTDLSALSCPERLQQKEPIKVIFSGTWSEFEY